MDVRMTFALGAGLAALAAFAGWRGARPPDLMKGPRLIPWRPIMVAAAVTALITLAQAAQMSGLAPR